MSLILLRFARVCKGCSEHFRELLSQTIRLANLGRGHLALSEMEVEESAWGTI